MKIFNRYVYVLVSKKPFDTEKLKQLKEGSVHLRRNPQKKVKNDHLPKQP